MEGIVQFDGQTWTTLSDAPPYVTALAIDPRERVWVGASSNLSMFDGVTWTFWATASTD